VFAGQAQQAQRRIEEKQHARQRPPGPLDQARAPDRVQQVLEALRARIEEAKVLAQHRARRRLRGRDFQQLRGERRAQAFHALHIAHARHDLAGGGRIEQRLREQHSQREAPAATKRCGLRLDPFPVDRIAP